MGSHLIFLFIILLIPAPSWAQTPPTAHPPLPVGQEKPLGTPSTAETLRVPTLQVEIGKTLTLPAQHPTRYLVASPEVAQVIEMKAEALLVRAQKRGTTLILWWDRAGIQSAQITVTRPAVEIERSEELEIRASELYQSQARRKFRVFYESQLATLAQEKVLPRVTETRKVYHHDVRVEGGTPLGLFKGNLFYEYRKDQNLKKSVALVRDMWFGFFETNLPFTKWLDNYDVVVGRQYLKLSDFGFAGSRFVGFSMVPSAKRIEHPERGRLDFSLFLGRERRGGLRDNPAGTQQRNIELNQRLMGQKVDFYLWRNGKISAGAYHRWGGPTEGARSKRNFDLAYDFKFPYLRLKGELAMDQRMNLAKRFTGLFENSWLKFEPTFFRVNPRYGTIAGTTLDRGRRGFVVRSEILPLKPFWENEALRFDIDYEIGRDLLSLNPNRQEKFNRRFKVGMNWRLPYGVQSATTFEEENRKATSFPFTRKRVRERLTKDFIFPWRWLRRVRVHGVSTWERYGDAEATPGYNSQRYELGGGLHASLFGNAWISAQYLWNRLDEKEPEATVIDGRTYPGQMTLAGGVSHSFAWIPLQANMSVRYVDERKTLSKLHQPFSDEDRFEARGSLNLRLPNQGVFFVEANAIQTRPLSLSPEVAEFSLVMGTRIAMDTPFYLPQKGTIEGYFFIDQNANGIRDPGEPGVSGYEVRIVEGPQTRSNQKGYYRLRVQEGIVDLQATRQIPEGYFFTTLNQKRIEMLPKKEVTVDFGIVPQTQVKGQAYVDANRNQIFDEGDIPVSAIQIVLESGQLAVTSPQGLFSILRVRPGANRAQVVVASIPIGYRTVSPIMREFEGMPGDVLIFDVVMKVERLVSGLVFVDENQNSRPDASEKGLPGVLLRLGEKRATTTGEGRYLFADLDPGTQRLSLEKESLPEGYEAALSEQKIEVSKGYFEKRNADFPLQKSQN